MQSDPDGYTWYVLSNTDIFVIILQSYRTLLRPTHRILYLALKLEYVKKMIQLLQLGIKSQF